MSEQSEADLRVDPVRPVCSRSVSVVGPGCPRPRHANPNAAPVGFQRVVRNLDCRRWYLRQATGGSRSPRARNCGERSHTASGPANASAGQVLTTPVAPAVSARRPRGRKGTRPLPRGTLPPPGSTHRWFPAVVTWPPISASKCHLAAQTWWAQLGSNQRPLACKASALPLSYAPLAAAAGLLPRPAYRSVGAGRPDIPHQNSRSAGP